MSASNHLDIHRLEGDAGLTLRERVERQRAWNSRGTITGLDNVGPLRWNVAIETLPDDVLLEIFDFCLDEDEGIDRWYGPGEEDRHLYDAWYALAHVYQR